MTNQLIPIEMNNQRILTTQQLAAVYGASEQQVQQNFNNHKDNFVEGKHYYLLKGEELRDFKNHFDNIEVPYFNKAIYSSNNLSIPSTREFFLYIPLQKVLPTNVHHTVI